MLSESFRALASRYRAEGAASSTPPSSPVLEGNGGNKGNMQSTSASFVFPLPQAEGPRGNRLAVAVSSARLPPVLRTPDLSLVPTPHMSKLQRGSSGGPPRRWMDMSLPHSN